MSHSPDRQEASKEDEQAADGAADPYVLGWAAINKLMRRGFSWSGHERNCAFQNLGDGRFANASSLVGFDHADDGRALAVVDWDQDGDLDLFLTNRNGPRLRFLENTGDEPGLALHLRGAGSRPDASGTAGTAGTAGTIGARVQVTLEGGAGVPRRVLRGLRAGEGYLAQSSSVLSVGLARADGGVARVLGVQVRWPDGSTEDFAGVAGPGHHLLVQGEGSARPWDPGPPSGERSLGEGSVPAAGATSSAARRIVLAEPLPLPGLALQPPEGDPLSLFGVRPGGQGTGTGRAVLLQLWASWCAPCLGELERMAPELEDLERRGLAVLAVSVDEDAAAAARWMARLDWPRGWVQALPETVEILDALHGFLLDTERALPLPVSLLVDASGALRVLYVGPLTVEQVLEDLPLMGADVGAQALAAVPFPGRWHARPSFPLGAVEARLRGRGLERAAAEYGRAGYRVARKSRVQMLHEFARESAASATLEETLAMMLRALEEDPEYFPALFDLGQIQHRRGELHEAISAYRRALAQRPEHGEARFNLALAYAGTRQMRSARRELETLRGAASPLASELEAILSALETEGGGGR